MTEIELNKRTPVERLIIANTLIDSVIRESELELVNEKLSECMSGIETARHVLALMSEKDEYITDLEEECENLSEYNRLLVNRVEELKK